MNRIPIAALMLFVAAGCKSGRPAAEVERGKQAVIAVLDAWKANQPAGPLKSPTDTVQFTEELRATYSLSDYEIGPVDQSDKEVLRYRVTLHLKDKKAKVNRREVVYAVALRDPVVVSRDPYF